MARLLTILFVGLICEAIGVVLLSRGLKEISGWLFSPEDILAPDALANKLSAQGAPLSQLVWKGISPAEQRLLLEPRAEPNQKREEIAEALNSWLHRPGSSDTSLYDQIDLSKRTRELLSEDVKSSDRIELNRLLLEDSFPQDLRRHNGDTKSLRDVLQLVGRGLTNAHILLGVFFEALFFVGLLMLMSRADVSFVWPLTSLSFVVTTIAAKIYLHEVVSPLRWSGVCLIMLGAALISWTEKQHDRPAQPRPILPSPGQQAFPSK